MEVKEMTIADVLKMPLFFENVKRQLTSLWNDREKARKDATRNNTRLRAHVIDRMHNTGQWEPGNFVIRAVGMTAFNVTMQKLIDDEKARNNGNGDDK